MALLAVLFLGLAQGPVYLPGQILVWLIRFHSSKAVASEVALNERLAALGSVAVALGGIAAQAVVSLRLKLPDLHGSARWANPAEVKSSGLLFKPSRPETLAGAEGVYLGTFGRVGSDRNSGATSVFVNTADRHTFVLAPNRAGKGVGMVIPTLLSWTGSAVVHDMKGENFHLTAGWRQKELGHKVYLFDPTDPDHSACINPLEEIRLGDSEMGDIGNLVQVAVDPQGKGAQEDLSHWQKGAAQLITALVLHTLYAEEVKTLATCARLLSATNTRDLLARIHKAAHTPEGPHPIVQDLAGFFLALDPEELSGYVSTAVNCLMVFRDPMISRVTSRSDFHWRDLLEDSIPTSIYLAIPAGDQARIRPLTRMLVNQLCYRLVQKMNFTKDRHHPVLLLLDEFRSLGRLPALEESLAFFAGYGVRACIVCQDLEQLHKLYGEREEVTVHCHYKVVLTPTGLKTAEYISQLCGTMTVHHQHLSRRVGGLFGSQPSTEAPNEIRRPLLTPDEVLRLPADQALIFQHGGRPIRATRIKYYEDPEFARRASLPPPDLHLPPAPHLPVRQPTTSPGPSLSASLPRRPRQRS
ncbi:MAG TPA: type IV secretory system conjugative DNA transfer family protein [Thermoanaerobaculia bacterium]|nr:type IV secretory system conjugative DNA transfer family protein [Thermoanaerobaculia bacterium]